jgi:hypothetical protein
MSMFLSIIKKVLLIIVILLLCFFLVPGKNYKKQVFKIVQDNQEVLQECVKTNDYERAKKIDGIEEVKYYQTGPYTEFCCYGEGIVSSSVYYGFYYSPDDAPLGIVYAAEEDLEPDEKGFSYETPDSDNWYYTERITKNWYYYEVHS